MIVSHIGQFFELLLLWTPKCAFEDLKMMLESFKNSFILTGSKIGLWDLLSSTYPPLLWIFLPLYDQKVKKRAHFLPKMCFFYPKMKLEPSKKYCHPDRSKKVTYEPYYHPLAHVNFGCFCLFITKKSKKAHFGPKMCFFLPKNEVRAFQKYFHPERLKKLTNTIYYHSLAHLNLEYFCPYMKIVQKWLFLT